MKRIIISLFAIVFIQGSLFAATIDRGAVDRAQAKLEEYKTAKEKTDKEFEQAKQEKIAASEEEQRIKDAEQEELKKPEGERNNELLKTLGEQRVGLEKTINDANTTIDNYPKANEVNTGRIATQEQTYKYLEGQFMQAVQKSQDSFISKAIQGIKRVFTDIISVFKGKKVGVQQAPTLRDNAKAFSEQARVVKNGRSLAEELPIETAEIEKAIEILDALIEAAPKAVDPTVFDQPIIDAEVKLVETLEREKAQLQGVDLAPADKEAFKRDIEQAEKNIGLSADDINKIQQTRTVESGTAARNFIDDLFSTKLIDDFKILRDKVVESVKNLSQAELTVDYKKLMDSINSLESINTADLSPEQRSYRASLLGTTHSLLEQVYNAKALELGTKPNASQQDINTMIDLFAKSSDEFKKSENWNLELKSALEKETKLAATTSEYKDAVQKNSNAKTISEKDINIAEVIVPNAVAKFETLIDKPSSTESSNVFRDVSDSINIFIEDALKADPSQISLRDSQRLISDISRLRDIIDNKDYSDTKVYSDGDRRIVGRWVVKLNEALRELSGLESSNFSDLLYSSQKGKEFGLLPQIESANIPAAPPAPAVSLPKEQQNARASLFEQIRAGKELNKVTEADRQKSATQENSLVNSIAGAIKARRKAFEGEGQSSGGEWE